MGKIVFPDRIDFSQATLEKLHTLGAVLHSDTPADEDELIKRVQGAQIIVANFVQITKRVIDATPGLQYIIVAAAGYDTIDYRYAAQKGIPVLNCPTQNVEAVAEHAVSLMLACAHRVVEAATDLRAGKWNGPDLTGTEISHKKLGLVGYGQVGRLIEQKISGLAMTVTHVNSRSPEAELENLLRESDVICLCLKLTEATRNLMDRQRLSLLKKDAILVNVARGGVVDQAALFELLEQRRIRGAGIDVYADEPAGPEATPAIVALAGLPNVVATPHIAYNTAETAQRLGEELLANIASCLRGRPEHVVNPPAGLH